tara:strand:+ start:69 stop:824 length:756 start_codon:yes stop_codon:yes gene_type:complete
MNFPKKVFVDPRKEGITVPQFYLVLILLILAPFLGKIPSLITGEKITVKMISIANHENKVIRWPIMNIPKKYSVWEGVNNAGDRVTFEGSRNVIYKKGDITLGIVDNENFENSFIISFSGFYNNFDSAVALILITIWLSLFFIYGHSDKAWSRLRSIKKWYFKLMDFLCVVFLFWYILVLPVWLSLTIGWEGVIGFLIITLIIFSQLKETVEYLIFSDEQLKKREMLKLEKKRVETRELNAEIARRRKLKK